MVNAQLAKGLLFWKLSRRPLCFCLWQGACSRLWSSICARVQAWRGTRKPPTLLKRELNSCAICAIPTFSPYDEVFAILLQTPMHGKGLGLAGEPLSTLQVAAADVRRNITVQA